MATIQNARIRSTTLGREDHGIFTAFLNLDYGGAVQGFGGYALDGKPPRRDAHAERPGTAYGMEWIIRVLRVLDVDAWEKLPGTHCRAEIENGLIVGIGHILKDQWFRPKALYDEMSAQTMTAE